MAMQDQETKGQFGYHFSARKDEPHPTEAFVQIYVKSSAVFPDFVSAIGIWRLRGRAR